MIISEYFFIFYYKENNCKYSQGHLLFNTDRQSNMLLIVNAVLLPYTKHPARIKHVSRTATVSHQLDIQTSKCSSLQHSVRPGANLTLIIGNLSLEWTAVGDKFTTVIKIDTQTLTMSQQNGYVWLTLLMIHTICSSSGLIIRWAGEPHKIWLIVQSFLLDSNEIV